MKVIAVGLFLGLAAYLQISGMIKNKKPKKELFVYIALMIIAAYLAIGSLSDIYIPNPTKGLKLLFQPVQDWIDKLLS